MASRPHRARIRPKQGFWPVISAPGLRMAAAKFSFSSLEFENFEFQTFVFDGGVGYSPFFNNSFDSVCGLLAVFNYSFDSVLSTQLSTTAKIYVAVDDKIETIK